MRQFDSEGRLSEPELLEVDETQVVREVMFRLDAFGRGVALWQQQDFQRSNDRVWFNEIR